MVSSSDEFENGCIQFSSVELCRYKHPLTSLTFQLCDIVEILLSSYVNTYCWSSMARAGLYVFAPHASECRNEFCASLIYSGVDVMSSLRYRWYPSSDSLHGRFPILSIIHIAVCSVARTTKMTNCPAANTSYLLALIFCLSFD